MKVYLINNEGPRIYDINSNLSSSANKLELFNEVKVQKGEKEENNDLKID